MTSAEPTQDELMEWLAELATADEKIEPGTFTNGDWQDKFNVSDKTALKRIKRLIRDGLVEPCITRRPNIHGIWQEIRGYRYVGKTLAES